MRSLLNYDNPFIQLLCRIGDLMIANFLFCVCCLPVVTVGASLCGLLKVVQGFSMGGEPGILRTFFRSFRDNFRQATLAWLALLLLAVSFGCDLLIGQIYLTGTALAVLRGAVAVLALAVLAVASYLFPLLVRYENTLKEHCRNACILTILKLPRTLAITALNAAPFLLAWFMPVSFLKTLAVWLIVGLAGLCYLDCMLLRPVLLALEKQDQSPGEQDPAPDEAESEP